MQVRVQIVSVLVGLVLLGLIFQLIRRNKLLERYAILWIASIGLLLAVAIWKQLMEKLAQLIGIYYPPSALFVLAIFCGMAIVLHFSVVISQLTTQNNKLAQEVALLRAEMDQMASKLTEKQ